MSRALQLAEQGRWTCDPNPRVGCVLVRDGVCIGEAGHRRAGEDHAEIRAIAAAGGDTAGATAYVTLEPCSHYGRTPPCADALIEAGIARVVAGATDPNPRVAGRGLERLREAAVAVASGLMAAQSEALNPGFFRRMRGGLPWVRAKLAASLGARRWPRARADGLPSHPPGGMCTAGGRPARRLSPAWIPSSPMIRH